MGKKENGFLILITLILDITMGYGWYITLCPVKAVTHFDGVVGGAALMLSTLLVLVVNALIYSIAVAED